jgi:hypothetical protein
MVDEVVERNGHPRKLCVELRNMAHSFVLQNVELMAPWCLYATLNSILNIFKVPNIHWSFSSNTSHNIYNLYILVVVLELTHG